MLNELKKANGKNLLLQAISENKKSSNLSILVTACWEAGVDCSQELLFFIDLAIKCDYAVCLEVLTVMENTSSPPDKKSIADSIQKLEAEIQKSANQKTVVYSEMIALLNNKL